MVHVLRPAPQFSLPHFKMKVFITSLALLAVVSTGAALKCFICNSEKDSACSDPMQNDSPALIKAFVEECEIKKNESEPFCRKVSEDMEHEDTSRVHRECGYRRREEYDCYQKRSEDYIMNVCQCDTDLCNDSPALIPAITSLLAISFPLLARFI